MVYKLFKTKLLENSTHQTTVAECIRYFLQRLRMYIEEHLRREPFLDERGCTRYISSYLTTWDEETKQEFAKLIEEAGYGYAPQQIGFLNLSEASTAMAYFHISDRKRKPKMESWS